jgi:dGTPase
LDRTQPSLEAQLCNLADAIAYNAHDIDDGVRSGLISMHQLQSIELFERFRLEVLAEHPDLVQASRARRLLYETIRRMLSEQVYDVIASTQQSLQMAKPQSVEDVRLAGPLVGFSANMKALSTPLQQFLFTHLYRHPKVIETSAQAQNVVRDLYAAYVSQPAEMPTDFAEREDIQRAVSDYIAGMTDRFAAREHERMTGQKWLS